MTRKHYLLPGLLACTMLASCGGGGTGGVSSVASAPGPTALPPATGTILDTRTRLPPTPATINGNYQGFATFISTDATQAEEHTLPDGRRVLAGPIETVAPEQLAPRGSVSLAVDTSTRSYTLTVAAGSYQFPAGHMTMPAGSPLGYDRNNPVLNGQPADWVARGDMLTSAVSGGTAPDGAIRATTSWLRLYNVGQQNGSPRYLSAAEWGQAYAENASGVPGPENFKRTQSTFGILVFGQRTEPGDIPASGSAQYALASLINQSCDGCENPSPVSLNTMLAVDFATRKLTADYNWSLGEDVYQVDDWGDTFRDKNGNPVIAAHSDMGVHASGSSTVGSDGSFGLTLEGTGKVRTVQTDQPPVEDITKPVSGSLTGAFFGPKAAEVGGIAMLPKISSDGSVHADTDAFAGIGATP